MDIEQSKKMPVLRDQLLSIEKDGLIGRNSSAIAELDSYLNPVLNEGYAVAEFDLLSEMLRREAHRLAGAKTVSQNEMRSLFQELL